MCSEYLYHYNYLSGDSRSSSSHSSHDNISTPQQYTIPSIAVLSPSNGRPPEVLLSDSAPGKSSSNNNNNNNKREQEFSEKEKSYKVAKFSEIGQKYEKENVDPRSTNVSRYYKR